MRKLPLWAVLLLIVCGYLSVYYQNATFAITTFILLVVISIVGYVKWFRQWDNSD
ncbi:MAG: hypothetical protein Kow0080_35570 [Candidatus Promineifilaceae bacterium]